MLMGEFFNSDVIVPMMVFAIPIVAIVGGITTGIIQMLGRQRLVELAQQERIAAIQRGIDPAKLAPLPMETGEPWIEPNAQMRRRAQGLLVGGIVTLFAGVGVGAFLKLINPDTEHAVWAVGIIPVMVGIALLISAKLVWPGDGNAAPPRT